MATVSVKWDTDRPGLQVTWEERLAQLRALDERPQPEIDCSEIPEITDLSGWQTRDEMLESMKAKSNRAATV
jgi:hypothetical protein